MCVAAKACGNEWEIEAGPTFFFFGEQCLAWRRHKEKAGKEKKNQRKLLDYMFAFQISFQFFFFFFLLPW
jgi:hypothetical protein